MFVDVYYQVTERIEIDDRFKPLMREDNYELRADLENELHYILGARLSVTEINLSSCYAVGTNDSENCLFDY